MPKQSAVLSLFLVAALMLAACAAGRRSARHLRCKLRNAPCAVGRIRLNAPYFSCFVVQTLGPTIHLRTAGGGVTAIARQSSASQTQHGPQPGFD